MNPDMDLKTSLRLGSGLGRARGRRSLLRSGEQRRVLATPDEHHEHQRDANDHQGGDHVLVAADVAENQEGGLAEEPAYHCEQRRPEQGRDSGANEEDREPHAGRAAGNRHHDPQTEREPHSEHTPPRTPPNEYQQTRDVPTGPSKSLPHPLAAPSTERVEPDGSCPCADGTGEHDTNEPEMAFVRREPAHDRGG